MAITFRSSATKFSSSGSSVAIDKPTGTVEGDVLLCVGMYYGGDAGPTAPAGWVSIGYASETVPATDYGHRLHLWRKVAGASEPSTYTWSMVNTDQYSSFAIACYSGVDTSSPVDVFSFEYNGDPASGMASASVTTTVNDAMVVFVGCAGEGYTFAGNVAPPSGFTERVEHEANWRNIYIADAIQSSAGATGSVASAYGVNLRRSWGGIVALKASSGGGATDKSGTDSSAGSESLTLAAAGSVTDTGASSDSLTLAAASSRADSASASDSQSLAAALALADSASASDVSALAASLTRTDSASGTESSALARASSVSDSASGAEGAALSVALAVGDTGTATESSTLNTGSNPASSDAGTGGESASLAASMTRTDAATAGDAALVAAGASVADSGTGNDTRTLAASSSVTDTGTSAELAQAAVSIAVGDAGAGADTSLLTAGGNPSANDTGAGGEVVTVTGALAASDVGASADAVAIAVAQSRFDAGVAAESAALAVVISVGDAGSALESSALNAGNNAIVTDGGTSTESASLQVVIAAHDAGVMAEAVLIAAVLVTADTARARDRGALVKSDMRPRAVPRTVVGMANGRERARLATVRDRGGRVPKMRKR